MAGGLGQFSLLGYGLLSRREILSLCLSLEIVTVQEKEELKVDDLGVGQENVNLAHCLGKCGLNPVWTGA